MRLDGWLRALTVRPAMQSIVRRWRFAPPHHDGRTGEPARQSSLRAKRSNPSLHARGKMDCFVASLLAMTAIAAPALGSRVLRLGELTRRPLEQLPDQRRDPPLRRHHLVHDGEVVRVRDFLVRYR